MFKHRVLLFTLVLFTCIGFGVPSVSAGTIADRERHGRVTTIWTFDPTQSQLPEGIALDKEGNIYVGLYPTGQIWKITSDGQQSVFATLNVGTSGGGLVGITLDGMGGMYVCDATFEAATHGIWHVDQNGATTMLAALDPTGFPNAIALDKAGNLYVTDSYLGEIWKVSSSGEASVWIKSPLLDPASPTCCYGANGIEFDRGDLFVANTDLGTIVRIKPGEEDSAPRADVYVKSPALVGADGLSFDVRHNMYVTADYQNTLLEVTADGEIQTLATIKDGLDFPADTAFGEAHGQRTFLFWTSGGWNFMKPTIQKMDVGIPGAPLY